MSTKLRELQRPEDNEEFRQLRKRAGWGSEKAACVLGRNEKTLKRWNTDRLDVDPDDLLFMRDIRDFLDAAQELHESTKDVVDLGAMSGPEFCAAVLTFGWDVTDDRPTSKPPSFAEITGINPAEVRLMAFGRMAVSPGLSNGLRRLLAMIDDDRLQEGVDKAAQLLHLGEVEASHAAG